MKIVIIEDEQHLASEFCALLGQLRPSWSVLQVVKSVNEGLTFFESCPHYDLVFSDIQLGDGLSFQIFQQRNISAPIIFCTAYNQYALEAFKNQGIDYILKPFDQKNLLESILRFEDLKKQLSGPDTDFAQLMQQLTQAPKEAKTQNLLVRHKDKIIPIQGDNIALCHIRNGLVFITDLQENRYAVSESMDELEIKLGSSFYRVDRQHLVNRKAIRDVSQHLGRKLAVNILIPYPELLLVRKEKATEFLNWLSTHN